MMFLSAVVFFLSMIGLTVYAFATLDNTLLGLAAMALIGIASLALVHELKENA